MATFIFIGTACGVGELDSTRASPGPPPGHDGPSRGEPTKDARPSEADAGAGAVTGGDAAASEDPDAATTPESGGTPDSGSRPASLGHLAPECGSARPLGEGDYLLFQGESLAPAEANTLQLIDGWRADEAWGPGRLESEAEGQGSRIRFSNVGIYHGFKFTPPTTNGQRRRFRIEGVEVHLSTRRETADAAPATFGLRVIKPGEFEGAGGAPTTTWMLEQPSGGSRFLQAPGACGLVTMFIPAPFTEAQQVGDRLIWEMQSNWNPGDVLFLHRIVLTGFRFVD